MKADIESLDDEGFTPFLTASDFGHVNVLKLLIEWQCDTAARNKNNNGALALAALKGQMDAIQFLVNIAHLPINDKNNSGQIALQSSCVYGDANVCQLLLEMKADVESQDDYGYTPFLTASHFGHVNVLMLLIEWHCDTAARDKDNNGALAVAAFNGQMDAIQFLVNVVHLPINDRHFVRWFP
jgi:ankyrin repeat protein